MKFFTDRTVKNDYLLIKIKDYLKMKDFSRWKEVFIDPGVYELTKSNEYSWVDKINIYDFITSLPDDHYFSLDYPCDMNPKYQREFILKSWINAISYHQHPQYLVTVQFKFNNYWNFVEWFDRYNYLEIKSGILGLGNLCRFRSLTNYIKHAMDYAFSHCNHPRIHIYGLCLKAIPYADKLAKKYNIDFSFDSTKWTRACTTELKERHGYNSQMGNRQEFFDVYKKRIEELIKAPLI